MVTRPTACGSAGERLQAVTRDLKAIYERRRNPGLQALEVFASAIL